MTGPKTAKAGFSDLVLVCRKCAKRQGVARKQIGRAVKRALKQEARGDGSAKRAGKVRLVETGCLGPCPKRMLTLATPDSWPTAASSSSIRRSKTSPLGASSSRPCRRRSKRVPRCRPMERGMAESPARREERCQEPGDLRHDRRPAEPSLPQRLLRGLLRRLPLVGTLVGLGLGVWLVATNDLAAIGAAFGRIGAAGLAAIVGVRVVIVLLCGLAWASVLAGLPPSGRSRTGAPAEPPVETGAFVILRFVREGVNVLLPVASVGGEVVGGRLLTFWGVAGSLAAASLLADMLIQVATQVAFTGLGAALLWRLPGRPPPRSRGGRRRPPSWRWRRSPPSSPCRRSAWRAVSSGASPASAVASCARRPRRAKPEGDAAGILSVQEALDAVWARDRRGRIAQSVALHAVAWGLGAAEIWIVLACIGVEVSLTEVLVLESLSQAIKSAAFAVPSGLGVQEGGFVVVGALFGLDAGTAIALSLAKRVPDVVLGLPSLIVWQSLEAKRAQVLPPR
ncbi:lysylphosphatidylglycerol synthase domain-containing protein [Methylorubrum aminovorans]|uniref:lysylphosphatidylglycerol synthase domain-containing protein n=1 Tax=Methylorubrum aminovorans TaxID=269069 RepID=UPI0024E0523B|nr:lysylphosphatidylglycerol synthase domain-containing protein [Methylorubrum aminovorans]